MMSVVRPQYILPLSQVSQWRFTGDHRVPKVAVVSSGCGVHDGSEITEAVSILIALTGRAEYQIFAPNENQMHVINHMSGEEMKESRNVLIESARIARGKIKDMKELKSKDYDAVVLPGGFGAAKNLSSFATKGTQFTVNQEVERVIKEFHKQSKPLGFCCISPVIAARIIPGVEVTVGSDKNDNGQWPYAETADAINKIGAKHVVKSYNLAHIDKKNKVVTSAAYMFEGTPKQIYESVTALGNCWCVPWLCSVQRYLDDVTR